MLTIAKVGKLRPDGSPGASLEYYASYVERGGEHGHWLGEGAAVLGLTGEVSREQLVALGQGLGPDATTVLVARAGGRVPAWDLTFSAPKSVSVLHGLGDATTRAQLRAAHDQAVAAAVGWMEAVGGRGRRGRGGRDGHVAAGLVVAGFVHATSRALDPDLHTHALVLNVGAGEDGVWSSLDSRLFYRHKMAAGAIYRAELRRAVTEMGGTWGAADARDLFELAGLDRVLLRHFSTRRRQIEDRMAERGTSGARAAAVACLETRTTKVDVELTEVTDRWRAEAAELGWGTERLARCLVAGRTGQRSVTSPEAVIARLLGPSGLTAARSTFGRDDVIRALAEAMPEGASAAQLGALANVTLGRPEVRAVAVADGHDEAGTVKLHQVGPGSSDGRGAHAPADALVEARYTTTELLAVEERLIAWAMGARSGGHGLVPSGLVEAAIAARGLSAEQAEMVRALCTSGDGVSVVIGVPGAGKTWVLGAARHAWEQAGYRVLGAALAGRAADELEAGSGITSSTLDSLLATLDGACHGGLTRRTAVVVDEAGMADTRRLACLARHVERAGAKLVLVGDDRQLPAVAAGGTLAGLAARLGAVRLGENRRQRQEWERQALKAVRDGRADEAVAAYRREGRVVVADSPTELAAAIVERWWEATEQGTEVAMLARTREATGLLNALARATMGDAGRLGDDELCVGPDPRRDLGERSFAAGDQVMCLCNRRLGATRVRNGTLAVVESAHKTALVVRTGSGQALRLPRHYVAGFVDHGYAMTVHKSQGRTVGATGGGDDRRPGLALVWCAESMGAEAALVAASRATDATELFVVGTPEPLPTSHGQPEPVDPATAVSAAWSRSDADRLAVDELAAQRAIRELAGHTPHADLATRRAELDSLLSAPAEPAAAAHVLGVAAAVVDECHTTASTARAEDGKTLAAQRRVAQAEAELALAELTAHEADARRHAEAVAALGTDLRSARVERDLVGRALATQRRAHLDAVAADPPTYVTGLIGPPPQERAQALRWRAGISVIEDLRTQHHLAADPTAISPWVRAVGVEPAGPGASRYSSQLRSLAEVRRDLGIGPPPMGRTAAALTALVARSDERLQAARRPATAEALLPAPAPQRQPTRER